MVKGHEQQLTLPMEIQGPLNEIAKNSENSDNSGQTRDNVTKEECFFGVSKRIQNAPLLDTGEYVRQRRVGEIKDALGKEVHSQPWINLRRQSETAPEHMEIPPLLAPNFDKQVGEFDLESGVYGKATVRSYHSNNDGVIWAVVEDEYGRACIAGAQMKAKITSTGLREAWVDVGNFAMPLYEYPAQDRGLGDRSDWRGQYIGMWKNYLSKMPVIQEYLRARESGK